MDNKNTKSSWIIGGSIVVGFALFGLIQGYFESERNEALRNLGTSFPPSVSSGSGAEMNRYEFVSVNESSAVIFDRQTAQYWTKFFPVGEAPTEWTEGEWPFGGQ
ncbi:hypothetical protein [Saccharibacillus alkalitolerans]|uniref:Uncharacterized protein n=1 Tax=Saccharibacillus alkalitolerans TaxID=2705290 RepID=A0ABX0FCF4_9BACL|nr:hypothetical protein [Saccharibacillus alkalitolerans]NGZ76976.1 hypothetical protein [Saccharibacillus alkalitolerans]